MSKCVILGYSGHSFVVIDAIHKAGLNVDAYSDKVNRTLNPYNLEYLGYEGDENFDEWSKGHEFILGIGDNLIRENVANHIIKRGERLVKVIHPSSIISSNVDIGEGAFIAAGVIINPLVSIGKNVIINTGALVEHEGLIDDNVHIAPGAVVAGNVKIGHRSFIGANAVIKEGVEIGNDVIVGAGAVVIDNIRSQTKVVGNPARIL